MTNRWGPVYPLPDHLDPPLDLCVQLTIPNDKQYYQQLWSLINVATIWMAFDRDDAHSGAVVANTWKRIIKTLTVCGGVEPPFFEDGADTEMSIRQNPDNPCLLESSVDGTHWCVFADISKCLNFGTPAGTSTDQPKPGGGASQYCYKLQASQRLLIPVTVNSGDTVTLNSADGSTADPDEDVLHVPSVWRLSTGDQAVGGIDVGFPRQVTTDPLPTLNHMKVIALTNGAFFDLVIGTPSTVPPGIVNGQLWLQVNDDDLSDDQGWLDICVTVQNNQNVPSDTLNITYSAGTGPTTITYGVPFIATATLQTGTNHITINFPTEVDLTIQAQFLWSLTVAPTAEWLIGYLSGAHVVSFFDPPNAFPTDFPAGTGVDAIGIDSGNATSVYGVQFLVNRH